MVLARPRRPASSPALLFTLALACGCGSGGSSSSSGAPAATAAATPSATASGSASPEAGPERIDEGDVKKLVEAWLAAQNSGDLNAYLGLYAERFEGVKRSGDRARRFDRKGWAADRGQMFQKKMVVSADAIQISTAPTMARVDLTQTWASGSYKDVGPKRLVVVKEKGALRIAREEMLASTIDGVKRLPPPPATDFAFVIQDGGTRVVLDATPDLEWAEGAAELLADADPYPTRRAVAASKLPPALAAWSGQTVRLYGPAGPVCEATIGRLSLVARVIPHFGEAARWHGTGDYQGQRPLSKAGIASAAWGLAAGAEPRERGVVLAADLASPSGDCKSALWAQPSAAPVRKVGRAEDAPADLAKRALAALRKLPEYEEIQKTADTKAPWDSRGSVQVTSMKPPSGKELVFVSANAVDGCAGFQGNLSAVFEVGGDRLTLAGKPMGVPPEGPSGVIETASGKLEILFTERLLRGETGYDQVDMLIIPNLDCGC